jgi:hypothetical protein
MAVPAGIRGHGAVGTGLNLKLTLLVMLPWLSGMSGGDKCDDNGGIFTGYQDRKDVEEVARQVQADNMSPVKDLKICLIRGGAKCLGISADLSETTLVDKIIAQAAEHPKPSSQPPIQVRGMVRTDPSPE